VEPSWHAVSDAVAGSHDRRIIPYSIDRGPAWRSKNHIAQATCSASARTMRRWAYWINELRPGSHGVLPCAKSDAGRSLAGPK